MTGTVRDVPPSARPTVLVTGAGRGIGRQLAVGMARQQMTVALLGRRPERLAAVARECADAGARVVTAVADVTSVRSVRAAVDLVHEAVGHVDVLVNNAGLMDEDEVALWEADWERWWQVFETNFRGSFNMCRAVLPNMVARRTGRIVNINSIFSVRHDIRYSAYSTSKAALLGLTDTLAGPLAEHGVFMFDISPGMVDTDMTRGMSVCAGRTDWTSVDRVVDAVVRVARGELDPLSGRFLHVGVDDTTDLLARSDELRATDARTVRLRPHGPADPLAAPVAGGSGAGDEHATGIQIQTRAMR